MRPVLRGLPLRPRRPVRGAHGPGRPLRAGWRGDGGGQDRRSAAAPGGRRPAEVPAGGAALRRADRPAGAKRAARAGTAGEDRPRLPAAHGQESRARPAEAAQEDPPEQGAPQRTDALVRQAQGEGRGELPASRPHGRDAEDQVPEAPDGVDGGRGRRPGGGGRDGPPGGPGRRPLAGRDRLRGQGARPRTADIRRGVVSNWRPRSRHPAGRHRPGHPGARLRRAAGKLAALLGVGKPGRGGTHRLLAPPSTDRRRPSPSRGRTASARPGR